jgi:phage shock protein PspC (stress-responsive transcriptional regulator)
MKALRRSRTDRRIGGVCGGIGEYFGIDPNAVRLIWIVATVFTMGIGVLLYLLAWLLIPEEGALSTGTAPAGATSGTSASAGTAGSEHNR